MDQTTQNERVVRELRDAKDTIRVLVAELHRLRAELAALRGA